METYRKIATVQAKIFKAGDEDGTIDLLDTPYIKTLENNKHFGEFGKHYLCVGIDGEKWLVEKSIFERTYELVHETISCVLEKEKEPTPIEWLVEYIHSEEYQRAFGQTYISPEIWMKAVAMQNERDERLRDFDTWKEWKTSNNF
ncbi:hypothetical protein UFOVP972_151 [uncultured Caudovirales phage]|jgi:hypothetical protein|uniref:Phage protein n=1 Tax=uncultured Caudovirales phage TaxID=2100421 RepID=A0A6J5PXC8_9CAUD|nr:hypothetical protein UFOVP972_151 [uncultured Caudovirales phage]